MGKIKIKCDTCGKEFEKYESKLGKNNFCCRDCYNIYHSRNTKKYICEICGKKFSSNQPKNANKFCSRECYNKFHNIKNKIRICPVCGKKFTARTSEDKYCSQECHLKNLHSIYKGPNHWNWQGGISKENDGEQHFSLARFGDKTIEQAKKELDKYILHDNIKNNWCLENNKKLLRYSYKDFNKLEELLGGELWHKE